MDISSYQICSDPKTWVFDDLLSTAFLDHVDSNFLPQVSLSNDAGSVDTWRVDDPALAQEFIDLLVRIGGVEPTEDSLRQVTIGDVRKTRQSCHMDRMEVGGKFPHVREDAVGFLDMSRQDVLTRSTRPGGRVQVIVPTLSFVVYFEDYPGGIDFPDAARLDPTATAVGIGRNEDGRLSIDGRRGRIIMFQNYRGDHASANPRARHFGTFDPLVPKRTFIGGLASNENPPDCASGGSHAVPGLLYGVCESIALVPQVRDGSSRPREYLFAPHDHHQECSIEPSEEEERARRLLAASISRKTAAEYPARSKESLIRLLTIFSKVDSVRERASLRPINSDIWWYILSMMNGTDLTVDDDEEEEDEDSEVEHQEEEEVAKLIIATGLQTLFRQQNSNMIRPILLRT